MNTWRAIAAALQFLTRLPIPARTTGSEQQFRASTVWFPFAGFVIGVIVATAAYALQPYLPPMVTAVLVLALWVGLTGGLHLDGLMDTADGVLSHRSRERMLEIMKDSRVGAMGVIVCVLYLMLKAALLIEIVGNHTFINYVMLTLIPIWSRAFMVTSIFGWPYARTEPGIGSLFQSVRMLHAAGAGGVALMLSAAIIVLWLTIEGFTPQDVSSLGAVVGAAVLALVTYLIGTFCAALISRKLGGLTGDVYGALNEIIELALLLTLVLLIG